MRGQWTGLAAILGAGTIWGLSPVFWRLLSDVPALEVLAHRTVWSAVFFAGVIVLRGRGPALAAVLRDGATLRRLALSAALVAANWLGFILAIQLDRTSESSLGYYLFPLLAVAAGWALHGERFAPLQIAAFLLAIAAVALLFARAPRMPWLAVLVALSFTIFGLVKRGIACGPMISVTVEMGVLLIPALVWIGGAHLAGWTAGPQQPAAFGRDATTTLLLLLSVLPTALPLMLFAHAAQRLRYSAIGVAQYVNPTLQFFCAAVLFGEVLSAAHVAAFALIWVGVALYCVELLRRERRARSSAITASGL